MQSVPGFLSMAWSCLLLLLLTYPPGSSSQPVLTQRPSASFSSGETVRLSCTLNAGYSISSYRVGWYQQLSGGAPRFVYHYYSSSSQGRGSGVPERFSVSPDSSNNLWNLVITGTQDEDEADYYCGMWYSSNGDKFHSERRGDDFLSKPNTSGELTMGQFLFLLALFTYCSEGVTSQSAWTQPASESVSPGQTAKLSCTTNDGSRSIHWYQQRSGEAPLFLHCEGCSNRGEGIPDRFTASRSGSIGYLTITNIQARDEAVYYCGRWNTAGIVFHGGTI
ncbi:uncharacterized protein LOC144325882 [Podarcis muralis]